MSRFAGVPYGGHHGFGHLGNVAAMTHHAHLQAAVTAEEEFVAER